MSSAVHVFRREQVLDAPPSEVFSFFADARNLEAITPPLLRFRLLTPEPIAMGAALGIHPLAVLIVTIAGGALFGAVGLILAAPLTSAVTRIAADLAQARGEPAT